MQFILCTSERRVRFLLVPRGLYHVIYGHHDNGICHHSPDNNVDSSDTTNCRDVRLVRQSHDSFGPVAFPLSHFPCFSKILQGTRKRVKYGSPIHLSVLFVVFTQSVQGTFRCRKEQRTCTIVDIELILRPICWKKLA